MLGTPRQICVLGWQDKKNDRAIILLQRLATIVPKSLMEQAPCLKWEETHVQKVMSSKITPDTKIALVLEKTEND